MKKKSIRIGGASGAWGYSAAAVPQLVRHGNVDFLVFDYLAELTMSLLTAARMKNPEMGYATDFVDAVAAMLPEITKKQSASCRTPAASTQRPAPKRCTGRRRKRACRPGSLSSQATTCFLSSTT